jgi:uncharacterized protein
VTGPAPPRPEPAHAAPSRPDPAGAASHAEPAHAQTARRHVAYLSWPVRTVLALYLALAAVRIVGAYQSAVLIVALVITPVALVVVPVWQWPRIGICRPRGGLRLIGGVAATVAAYALSVGTAVLVVGTGNDNWAAGLLGFFQLGIGTGSVGTAMDIAAAVLGLGVVVPVLEEVFYRGLLHSALLPHVGKWATVLLTAFAWALVHLGDYGLHPFNPLVIATVLPSVLIMGIALGWTRIWTGSALGSAIAQGVANLLLALWVSQW